LTDRTDGAAYFRTFAGFARNGGSPLYERLALAAADDPEMLALATQVRSGQPQANTLLAAVHLLLLKGEQHPLGAYFPSCGGTRKANEGDPYSVFCDFVAQYRAALIPILTTRVTNTNDVGRSALIYPALDIIARETEQPLSLVEIGPSAGLNLNWYRYGYHYINEVGEPPIERNLGAGLILASQLKGAKRPSLSAELPAVAAAIGLELNPVDLTSAEERLWLRALIWPERLDRMARFDAALEIARNHLPRIVEGRAERDLETAMKDLPSGPLCIIHTHVLYQFDAAAKAAFESALDAVAKSRPLYRLSVELDGHDYPIQLSRSERGAREVRRLAHCDPHGAWIEWLW